MEFSVDEKTYRSKLASLSNTDLVQLHNHLVKLLEIKQSDQVLDLGCGHGNTLISLSKQLGKSGTVTGLDVEERLLAVAERVLQEEITEGKVKLIKSDASKKFPFPDNSFDKIVCHNVVECIPDKISFVNECHRVLKNNGLLVLSHNDFDTQVYNSSFPELTRKLVHHYCDTKQEWMETSDGMIGRKLWGVMQKSPFVNRTAKTYVTTNTEFAPKKYGYTLAHNIIEVAKQSNKFTPSELREWIEDLVTKHAKKEYFYSINMYVIVATKT